jgi:hypothetical protein
MKIKIFVGLAAVALLVACVPSVNPFYTDKDVVTDPRLAGTWVETGKKERAVIWDFAPATNNACAVALRDDDGKSGKFEGHLFKLGQELFLDVTPTECKFDDKQAGLLNCAMLPGHLLFRVKLADDKFFLAVCKPDWTQKFLEKNPAAIAHRVVDGSVILTAETAALQKFVLRHLGKDELFGDFGEYQRLTDRPATPVK